MNETILITGGSGLIGFDRQGRPYPPSKVDCVSVDPTSDESVQHGLTCSNRR